MGSDPLFTKSVKRGSDPLCVHADVLAELRAHARAEAPRECCGLLLGTTERIARSVRARNIAPGATRYLIDPEDHFSAIRAARMEGLDVIGAYHSHPSGEPVPSATDIAEANSGPEFVYVIVSAGSGEARAYRFEEGRPRELALQTEA